MGRAITLPGGFWHRGRCHRQAELRALAGKDETFFMGEASQLPPARRTTALLVRCLERLGPLRKVTSEAVRSLSAGDREALLLHLRRLTFGDRLQCVLSCPEPACGEKLDLDLKVKDLLVSPELRRKERYDSTVQENGVAYRVRFRLPSGADQEAAAEQARSDPAAAAEALLRRCVEEVKATSNGGEACDDLPPGVARQLASRMAELDPQAELTLQLDCPLCGHGFSAHLDAAAFFFRELASRARNVYREVHLLALHYHWSEAEILAMTPSKRWLYLEMLDGSFSGEGVR